MNDNQITYDDIKRYEFLFTSVPSLLLGTMIRRNANLVSKFESTIVTRLNTITDVQKRQLETVLTMDVTQLQQLLAIAYKESGKKQYKLLSQPKAKNFIEMNLNEIRKLIEKH